MAVKARSKSNKRSSRKTSASRGAASTRKSSRSASTATRRRASSRRAATSGRVPSRRAAQSRTRTGATASRSRTSAAQRGAGPLRRESHITTDHEEIRRWAEERGAVPACVRGTGGKGDTGMIRLDFPGYSGGESLEAITWDEWFEKFDANNLALLYEETTARGHKSNFNKIISRERADTRSRM